MGSARMFRGFIAAASVTAAVFIGVAVPAFAQAYPERPIKVTSAPETAEFMLKQGLEPFPGTPESTTKQLAATIDEWSRIVKIVKIEPQ